MVRKHLTDLAIRATKPGAKLRKISDGDGLQLWVQPTGSKLWRLAYRFRGKQKLIALGAYPVVSLENARRVAAHARILLAEGNDPSEVRKADRIRAEAADANTFEAIATRLIAKKRREGRAEVTLTKMQWIIAKTSADLAHRPIASITTPDVVAVLKTIEESGRLETARRTRTVIGEVFRYAMQHGLIGFDPVQATRGAIARPSPRHHPAVIDTRRLAELLRVIDIYAERNVIAGAALQLMALLYPRPGELRQAEWQEFDLGNATWTIPAQRMKMRQQHSKPLSRQAIAILRCLYEVTGPQGFVYPANGRGGRPMSENTMNQALKRMGVDTAEHVVHGFRSTASTLLNDSGLFSIDAIERELAHMDQDPVRRAYRRGDAWVERVKMAQWWADHLDRLRGGESVQARTANVYLIPNIVRQ